MSEAMDECVLPIDWVGSVCAWRSNLGCIVLFHDITESQQEPRDLHRVACTRDPVRQLQRARVAGPAGMHVDTHQCSQTWIEHTAARCVELHAVRRVRLRVRKPLAVHAPRCNANVSQADAQWGSRLVSLTAPYWLTKSVISFCVNSISIS